MNGSVCAANGVVSVEPGLQTPEAQRDAGRHGYQAAQAPHELDACH